ncbi:DUF6185 family protein [Streptomyces sp. NPDC001056]
MAKTRWWRLLMCLVAAVSWWGCPAAAARQLTDDPCWMSRLDVDEADATIRLDQHGRDYNVEVRSHVKVVMSAGKWPLTRHLTFRNDSADYRTAMRCLLRGNGDDKLNQNEWRSGGPQVSAQGDKVTVEYDAYGWIRNYDTVRIGPWKIQHTERRNWEITLRPQTLQSIVWNKVTAELGGLKFADLSEQATSVGANRLEWDRQPPDNVRIGVVLPWQRSFQLSYAESFWRFVSVGAWWVCASFVIVLAALRARPPGPVPPAGSKESTLKWMSWRADRTGGRLGENPAQAVLQWALLSVAIAMALNLHALWLAKLPRWRALACIAAGVALVLAARPWSRGAFFTAPDANSGDSSDSRGVQRRQVRTVVVVCGAVAATGMLVVLAPRLFGLPSGLASREMPSAAAATGLVLMDLVALWLWLAAMAAWAWRFAREGGLVSGAWADKWDREPVNCVAAVTFLLLMVAAALIGCCRQALERQWDRDTWLASPKVLAQHGAEVSRTLANAYFTDLVWLFARSWVLTCIALLSLLHFRVRVQQEQRVSLGKGIPVGPEGPDLFLTVVIFSFFVSIRGTKISGVPGSQYAIWFLMGVFSLYLVLSVGRRRSVMGQLGDFCERRLGTERRRQELLRRSHRYRTLNRQLYLVDQGRGGDADRDELEKELHKLRQWLVSGCGTRRPPDQISVLDVALAWGPEDHWWSNALRTARLAFCFGIPATAAFIYLDLKEPWEWTSLFHDPTGFPDIVAKAALYQMAWAGAGFVLGALWRLLPGRRSPGRAASLTIAYAVPVSMAALLDLVTDADVGYVFLYLLALLTILTLTSIWTDMATFREERQLWPSRPALLLSVYQLRGVSGQLASLLAQVSTAVTIWYQLAHG